MRTRLCDSGVQQGRMHKANQFLEAAGMIRELADEDEDVTDSYITLCVHAGIAASDVICCASVGKHSQGDSHDEAIGLLTSANKEIAKHLRTLLKLKTKAGYSHTPATADEFKRAGRAADILVETARRVTNSALHL